MLILLRVITKKLRHISFIPSYLIFFIVIMKLIIEPLNWLGRANEWSYSLWDQMVVRRIFTSLETPFFPFSFFFFKGPRRSRPRLIEKGCSAVVKKMEKKCRGKNHHKGLTFLHLGQQGTFTVDWIGGNKVETGRQSQAVWTTSWTAERPWHSLLVPPTHSNHTTPHNITFPPHHQTQLYWASAAFVGN